MDAMSLQVVHGVHKWADDVSVRKGTKKKQEKFTAFNRRYCYVTFTTDHTRVLGLAGDISSSRGIHAKRFDVTWDDDGSW